MQRIELKLSISAQEYQRFYLGQAKFVVAQAIDGRNVRFPANVLQQVVQHEGIYGRFAIEFDDQGKFQRILRLGA